MDACICLSLWCIPPRYLLHVCLLLFYMSHFIESISYVATLHVACNACTAYQLLYVNACQAVAAIYIIYMVVYG